MQTYTLEQSKKIYQDAKAKGLDGKKVIYLMAKQGATFDGLDNNGILDYGKQNYEPKPTFGENIKTSIAKRKENVTEISALRDEGKSTLGEVASMVSPKLGEKVDDFTAKHPTLAKLFRNAPTGGVDVPVLGQAAGAVQDVIGETISAVVPEKWKEWGAEKAQQVAENALAQAGIDTIEKYNAWAEKYPLAAKNIEGAANIALTAGDVIGAGEAASATTQGLKTGARAIAEGAQTTGKQLVSATEGVSKVISDIVPTKSEFMSGQISKALDLTQGDLSNIKLATGNDAGDFIARNNLIGGSKKETIDAVKKLTDSQYKLVRDEIAKVPNVYTVNDIPKVKQSLSLLEKQVKGVPGLEDTYKQVKALSKKTTMDLKDVQKVKELLDDQFSLFKMTGDVKEGTIKKGLANVRKNIKEFIETEVKNTTGADIAQLNNDVSTGKSIMKLAEKRSTRDFTRANVSLSDLGAFGAGSVTATPLGGLAAVAVKRIIETPTARLYLAKLINSLPKATQKAVQEELLAGNVPKIIDDVVKDYRLATNIKKSSPAITKKASIPKVSNKSVKRSSTLSTLEKEAKKYKSVETPLIKFAKKYKSISGLESDLPRFDSLSYLAKNVRALNLNKFPRLKGEDIITVYRGAHPNSRSITAGDWITLDKSTARNYSSNVQELKVKKSDIVNPGIQSDEYIFAPKSIESNTETLLKKANKK